MRYPTVIESDARDPDEQALKRAVRRHWEQEPCGTRGVDGSNRHAYFDSIEHHRYDVEPHIPAFADFHGGRGRRVIEIGVGAGTDHVNWLRAGARAVGVDLTMAGVRLTRERALLEGLHAQVVRTDAEALPFGSTAFDMVYSYGVVHCTPNTVKAVQEIHRILKPGGVAKVMIYHRPSIVGFLFWLYYCVARLQPWRSPKWAVLHHLESPGQKTYTLREARQLFESFNTVTVESKLGPGDLLLIKPSAKYSSPLMRLAWRLYPRWLIRRVGDRFGLLLMIHATK